MRSRRSASHRMPAPLVYFIISLMITICGEICSRISTRAALTVSFVGVCIIGISIAYTSGLLYRMIIAVRVRISPKLVSERLKAWLPYGTPLEIGAVFDRSRLLPAAILEAISAGELDYESDTQTINYAEKTVIARPDRNNTDTKQDLVLYFIDQCRRVAAPDRKEKFVTVQEIGQTVEYKPVFYAAMTDLLYRSIGRPDINRLFPDQRRELRHAPDAVRKYSEQDSVFFRAAIPALRFASPTGGEVLRSECECLTMLSYMLMSGKTASRDRDDFQTLSRIVRRTVRRCCVTAYDDNGLPIYRFNIKALKKQQKILQKRQRRADRRTRARTAS